MHRPALNSQEREAVLTAIDPDTRNRIEQAARELFAGREFHRVKLIDIARSARISLQTLYKYYGNKENVLFASLETWLATLAQRMLDHHRALRIIVIVCARCSGCCWITLSAIRKSHKLF